MEKKISIIVPIYKVEKYLDECISSIVSQSYRNLEIILVDDGSPDECPQICDAWAEKDERIIVIHKENGGLSDARNAGLHIAKGEYIGFVDSDDWIAPDMYEKMMQAIIRENADICACGIVCSYSNYQETLAIREVVGKSETILSMIYDDTAYPVAACNKLYHRSCWESMCFPVGKICEDAFTTYLLVDRANRIVQIKDALYYYRIRDNSIMTSSFSHKRMDEEEAWRCNYEYMKEKYPQIYKNAYDFYLQKVNILIHEIPISQREKFSEEYQYLHNILKNNLFYILFVSKISLKKRVKIFLDYIRL
ncbi:MAG: glycosyltransferase family 2 protein [Agathobacter sp.]